MNESWILKEALVIGPQKIKDNYFESFEWDENEVDKGNIISSD